MQTRNILIVSPKAYFRENLQHMLASDGHTVRTARDGLEALDTIRYTDFDLIATELALPQMDGIELVANAKDLQRDVRTVVFHNTDLGEREEMLRKMGVHRVEHLKTLQEARQAIEGALRDGFGGASQNEGLSKKPIGGIRERANSRTNGP